MSRYGPFTPVFDAKKRRGTVYTGVAIGEPPPVHGTATPGAIAVAVTLPTPTLIAESNIEFTEYWDFSNTANWTGALSTGQLPEVGTLAMKQIDAANGMALSTINGLQCAANTGGFLSARGEWGTDASLPAITEPYVLAIVYQISANDGAPHVAIACSPSNSPLASGFTPSINPGAPNASTQASALGNALTLTASTAPSDLNPHAALLVVDGASSELWVDDVLEDSGDLGGCDFDSGKRVVFICDRSADGSGAASGAASVQTKAGEGGLAVGTHPSTAAIHQWFDDVMTKWGV